MCLVSKIHACYSVAHVICIFSFSAGPAVLDQSIIYRGLVKGRISLTCTADGVPLPDIVWLKDDCPLSAHIAQSNRFLVTEAVVPGFRVHVPEARQSNLTIVDSTEKDGGEYSCWATNEIDYAYLPAPYHVTVDGKLETVSSNVKTAISTQ